MSLTLPGRSIYTESETSHNRALASISWDNETPACVVLQSSNGAFSGKQGLPCFGKGRCSWAGLSGRGPDFH